NSYDATGDRTQLLLAPGDPIKLEPVLTAFPSADALLLAPAYHELQAAPETTIPLVGVSLQGPLRTTDAHDRVSAASTAAARRIAATFVRPGWFAFFSEEDTPD